MKALALLMFLAACTPQKELPFAGDLQRRCEENAKKAKHESFYTCATLVFNYCVDKGCHK